MECSISAWNLFLAQLQIGLVSFVITAVAITVVGLIMKWRH